MHAWEAIQKTLDYIEEHLSEEISIDELAEIAGLSLFYFQRLFTRLVKTSIRDYIKLRRLARSLPQLRNKQNRIIDIAMEYGFGSHVVYTRVFKETYGITPSLYREKPIALQNFDKPDLLLGYLLIDEGVPLISDGLVLEMNRKFLKEPIHFFGVSGYFPFQYGKMFGERTGVDAVNEIWERFNKIFPSISHCSKERVIGVSYPGDAPVGYSSYFIGVEADLEEKNSEFACWQLPTREYVVCGFESDNYELMRINLGKAMKYTRFWLKRHNLIADGFFPEMYYKSTSDISYTELWIPFRKREK